MTSDARLARLTLLHVIRRRELDVLDARIDDARRAKAEAEAIWHARAPRPLVPLAAALASVLTANAALLGGFGIIVAGCRDPFFNGLFVLTAVIAIASLPLSGGEGAGGRVRPWLRRLSLIFLALSFAEVLYAANELEGVGFPIPT